MSAPSHTHLDDAQALLAGTLLLSLGIALLGSAQLVSGGIVGMALLLHYATGGSFALYFFLLNAPFYWLAMRTRGLPFVAKTVISVSLVASFSWLLPRLLTIGAIDPWYAAVMGGLLMGVGLLILFRHQASLGGLNILVLYLQDKLGWRAGLVQLALDLAILAASTWYLSWTTALISALGAASLNLSLAVNHRHDRYVAA
jgi:uncharacterized membrane-anchored protein YitT (DUF2179 family)